MSPDPTSRSFILILSSYLHLGIPSGILPSGFPTRSFHSSIFSPIRATCPAQSQSSWFNLMNDIWWAVQSIRLKLLVM
jgi:hypothetical protein